MHGLLYACSTEYSVDFRFLRLVEVWFPSVLELHTGTENRTGTVFQGGTRVLCAVQVWISSFLHLVEVRFPSVVQIHTGMENQTGIVPVFRHHTGVLSAVQV